MKGLRVAFGLVASLLRRSWVARVTVLSLVLVLAAGTYVLTLPERGDLRAILVALSGMGFLGIAGFFVVYRMLRLARRLITENAALAASLDRTKDALERLELRSREQSVEIVSDVARLTSDVERTCQMGLRSIEPRLSEIDVLRDGLANERRTQAGIDAEVRSLLAGFAERVSQFDERLRAVSQVHEQARADWRIDAERLRREVGAAIRQSEHLTAEQLAAAAARNTHDMAELTKLTQQDLGEVLGATTELRQQQVLADHRIEVLETRADDSTSKVEAAATSFGTMLATLGVLTDQVAEFGNRQGATASLAQKLAADNAQTTSMVSEISMKLSGAAASLTALMDTVGSLSEKVDAIGGGYEVTAGVAQKLAADNAQATSMVSEISMKLSGASASLTTLMNTVGSLAEKVDGIGSGQAATASLAQRLSADHSKTAAMVAEIYATQRTDRFNLARLQNEQQALAELQASTQERVSLLAEQAVEAAMTRDELEIKCDNLADAFAVIDTRAADTVDRCGKIAQHLAELEGREVGMQARLAAAVSSLEARDLSFDVALSDLKDTARKSGARADQLLQRVATMSAETSRIAVAVAELDGQYAYLADFARTTQGEQAALRNDVYGVSTRVENLEVGSAAALRALDAVGEQVAKTGEQVVAVGSEVAAVLGAIADCSTVVESLKAGSAHTLRAIDAIWQQIAKTRDEVAAAGCDIAAVRGDFSEVLVGVESQKVSHAQFLKEIDILRCQVAETLDVAAGADRDVAAVRTKHFDLDLAVNSISADVQKTASAIDRFSERQAEVAAWLAAADARIDAGAKSFEERTAVIDAALAEARKAAEDANSLVSTLDGRLSDEGLRARNNETLLEERVADLELHAAEIVKRLEAQGEQLLSEASGEKFQAIDADIEQVVRLVDEAEIAFAGEIARLSADARRNSAEVAVVGKRLADVQALASGKVSVDQHNLLVERIDSYVADRRGNEPADGVMSLRGAEEAPFEPVPLHGSPAVSSLRVSGPTQGEDGGGKAVPLELKAPGTGAAADVSANLVEQSKETWSDSGVGIAKAARLAGVASSRLRLTAREMAGGIRAGDDTHHVSAAGADLRRGTKTPRSGADASALAIGPADLNILEKVWVPKLSVSVPKGGVTTMAAHLVELVRRVEMNAEIQLFDAVLRALVLRAAGGGSAAVLFVGNLADADMVVVLAASAAQCTIVGAADESALQARLSLVGMASTQYVLVSGSDASKTLVERRYDVLVVGRDRAKHLESDIGSYARLVRAGGYLILEGYGDKVTPEVKPYADDRMATSQFLRVGNAGRTVVFQVKDHPTAKQVGAPNIAGKKSSSIPSTAPLRSGAAINTLPTQRRRRGRASGG